MSSTPEIRDDYEVVVAQNDGKTSSTSRLAKPAYQNLQTLVGVEGTPDEDVRVPAFAYRFMPSPKAADAQLLKYCPDKLYTRQKAALEEPLSEISPAEDKALAFEYKHWLHTQHGMTFTPGVVDQRAITISRSNTKDIEDVMEIFNEQKAGRARFAAITPTYAPFLSKAQQLSGKPAHEVPMLDEKDGWRLTMPDVLESLKNADVFFLCNPNNPNGYVYSEDELSQIVAAAKEHKVKLIVDEVWCDQLNKDTQKFVPIMNVAQKLGYADGVVMLYGVGKTFNTAQFNAGVAIIPDQQTRQEYQKKSATRKPSSVAALAAIDCMQQDGAEYVKSLSGIMEESCNYAAGVLNRIGFQTHTVPGMSVLFARVSETGDAGEVQKAVELFESVGIGVKETTGTRYGMPGYVRLNMGVPTAQIKNRYDRLEAAAKSV